MRGGAHSCPLSFFYLTRRFPTVERRARLISPARYYALPHDNGICDAVLLKCSEPTEEVLPHCLSVFPSVCLSVIITFSMLVSYTI